LLSSPPQAVKANAISAANAATLTSSKSFFIVYIPFRKNA
jgi:hypothetical protein